IMGGHGAAVTLRDKMRTDALLFGESQSRVIISTAPRNQDKVKAICKKHGVPCTAMGEVKGDALVVNDRVNLPVTRLKRVHAQAIPKAIGAA
ncbi:MAG: AIR synthase-related protein, partial [Dehalococcoidia bacterium]|nr:AIR synthase-related protein [Dehalococcoidia bacterium]